MSPDRVRRCRLARDFLYDPAAGPSDLTLLDAARIEEAPVASPDAGTAHTTATLSTAGSGTLVSLAAFNRVPAGISGGTPMHRLIYGCLAGLAAGVPMTATMERLQQRLPAPDRYELPPPELMTEAGLPNGPEPTLLAHFLYGGLAGTLFGLQRRRSAAAGATFGLGVWAASYLGWIPAVGLLAPATSHPRRRIGLMLIAHVIWGASLAASLREIERAEAAFTGNARPHSRRAARERGRHA